MKTECRREINLFFTRLIDKKDLTSFRFQIQTFSDEKEKMMPWQNFSNQLSESF